MQGASVNSCAHFLPSKTYQTVYRWFHVYTFSPAMCESTSCSAFLPPLAIVRCFFLLPLSVLLSCAVVSHHSFYFHFVMADGVKHLLMCLFAICRSPVIKCLFRSHAYLKIDCVFSFDCILTVFYLVLI